LVINNLEFHSIYEDDRFRTESVRFWYSWFSAPKNSVHFQNLVL